MTDQEIAQAAAKRWGCKKPSPSDIINQHVPQYGQDPAQTRRWHRIADLTYAIVLTPDRCEYCDGVLHGKGKRRYCGTKCGQEAWVEREARRSA